MGLAFASAFYTLGFDEYLATVRPLPALALSEFQIGALLAGTAFVAVDYVGAKETGSVQIGIVTILSCRLCEEIFDAARDHQADLVVVG
jgi:hypothetical protein